MGGFDESQMLHHHGQRLAASTCALLREISAGEFLDRVWIDCETMGWSTIRSDREEISVGSCGAGGGDPGLFR